jgi:hypothetical protein
MLAHDMTLNLASIGRKISLLTDLNSIYGSGNNHRLLASATPTVMIFE